MIIVPFQPEHVIALRKFDRQARSLSVLGEPYLERLATAGPAVTGIADGYVIACAGVVRVGPRSGTLWAWLGQDSARHMLPITRAAGRFFGTLNMRRLDATVQDGFMPGCRWLELLGFEKEGLMRAYGPDGSDHWRYARVSNG